MTDHGAIACEEQRIQAFMSGDLAALDRLFHDDLLWVHTSGGVDDKAGFIEKVSCGTLKFIGIFPSDVKTIETDRAVVFFGAQTIDLELRGNRQLLASRYSNTWVCTDNGWRMRYWQSTFVPSD